MYRKKMKKILSSWDYFKMQIQYISQSPEETFKAGEKLSRLVKGTDILRFSGELGGGKTTFISGLANGLKISRNLSSPSFTILNEYRSGKLKLIHIDLYRIDDAEEFENIGLDEYVYDDNCIVCIEWGEKVKDHVKREFLSLDFQYILDDDSMYKRKITLESHGPLWEKRLKKIEGAIIQ